MVFEVRQFTTLGKKIIGVGLNYRSVITERNIAPPKEPVLFLKPTSSYIVPGQTIELPKGFEVHHEVELGLIISKKGKNICPEDALDYIGGYCLALDLTAVNVLKEARSNGLPWTIGKGFDTACPVSLGLSKNTIKDLQNVQLWLEVNGKMKQDCSTSDMLFPCTKLISYISEFMTLEPYDLILTGSPAGTGRICHNDVVKAGLGDNLTKIHFPVKALS